MAECLNHSRIKNKVENYIYLRGLFKITPREDRFKIYIALYLLRILLELNENVKEFMKILEKFFPPPSGCTGHLAFLVKEVVNKDYYRVVKERNSSFSVSFPLEDNQPSLADEEIYSLLKECEQMFVHILSSCAICRNENFLQSITADDEKKSQKSIQEKVEFPRVPATNDNASVSTIPEPAPGLHVDAETSEEDNEQSKGSERQPGMDTEQTTGTGEPSHSKEFSKYKEEMIKQYEQHENFFEEEKKKELFEEKFCKSFEKKEILNHVFLLTYHNKDSSKIDYEFFEEEQKALWWAHENIERMGGDIKFIVVRRLIGENFSRRTTDDLMTNEVKLTSPLKPDIVITKVCTYDSAADIATVPFHPTMKQTFIHSVTTLNQELHLTVYRQLTINERKLKKIYKIELDPDKTWCAIGNPQIADLPKDEVKKILERIKRVIFEKKDQIAT